MQEIVAAICKHLAQTHNLAQHPSRLEHPSHPLNYASIEEDRGDLTAYYYAHETNDGGDYFDYITLPIDDPQLIPQLEKATQEWINQINS